jgi:hypothetical protein
MSTVNFWDPTGIWKGQDAILIGGGPSLKGFPFERLKGRNVIGINDAFRLGPEIVKLNFFGDAGWWIRIRDEAVASPVTFVTNSPTLFDWKIPNLYKMDRLLNGIGEGPVLGWNHNSGAASINLAYTMGASRIFLLGFDLTNQKGRSHWHDFNPNMIPEESFDRFQMGFRTVAEELKGKVDIFNVTDGSSRLFVFPRIDFDTFWAMLDGHYHQDAEAEGGLVEETPA